MAKKELCDLIIAAYLEKQASKPIVTSFKKHANINEDNLDKYDKFLDILECTTKMAQLIAPANDQDKDQDDKIEVIETAILVSNMPVQVAESSNNSNSLSCPKCHIRYYRLFFVRSTYS